MRSAEDGNGYQAWQLPLENRTARNATYLSNQLLEFDPGKCREYATRTGERVSDGIRKAVYMNEIAPQDMRQHLMLNQSRLSTADEVAKQIEDYWDATEEFSRDDQNQAGFIAPVGTGPVKGGKTSWSAKQLGKE